MENLDNIANSGFRVFSILQKILNNPVSKEELCDGFSEDTLAIYLNTLKAFGVEVFRPSRKSSFYALKKVPNFADFSEKDIKVLTKIKENLAQKASWKDVLTYNSFLLKLSAFTDEKIANKLKSVVAQKPFGQEEHEKISLLQKYIEAKTPLLLGYDSPRSNKNYFKILPKYLKLQNKKLYLWCLDNSIEDARYLRVERIFDIKILEEAYEDKFESNYAICEILNPSLFESDADAQVLKTTPEKLLVKYHFENSFEFIQKILNFGLDCRILEPEEMREKFKQKLNLMRIIYARKD